MTTVVCEEICIPESSNLKAITSEELMSENKSYLLVTPTVHNCDINVKQCFCPAIDLESDAVIAKILQEQFNQEYNEIIKNCKKKFNKRASLFLRGCSYHPKHQNADCDSYSDEENEVEEFEENNLQHSNKIIAKYDIKVNHTSPENNFETPKHLNKTDGSKPSSSYTKQEDILTAEVALDSYTRCHLHKLIKNRVLKSVNAVLSTGKESVILHANRDSLSPDCVIKIYKTTPQEFEQREVCIKGDGYFTDKIENHFTHKTEKTLRETTFLWAEKEMHNLLRINRAGIKCPKPLVLKQHMLVLSFIGENCHPAPQLKYAQLMTNEYELAYHQIVEAMKTFYHKAGLIHGDLTEHNILWHSKQCYFIDVSQSVEPLTANAFSLLLRDCENITKYFVHKGVKDLQTSQELFTDITDFDYNNKVIMEETINSFKAKYCDMDECDKMFNKNIEAKWQKLVYKQ